ncbi:MAG TPA: WecB/TagA/CpsF family glycosyltransferase [Rhodoblastus sp.]|nr:WecB/TagA/CpsF family glycosyltransferase [Rhodoblastus sp.]
MNAVRVNLFTPRQALEAVLARLAQARSFTLYTLNLDHVVKLRSSEDFRQAYEKADLVSADGWPIVWYFRRRGVRLQRTTGADLVTPLCEKAAEAGVPVFFIGPQEHVQRRALATLSERYPRLVVAGSDASFIDPDDTAAMDTLARRVTASQARLCFICLGAPKQEFVADALKSRCDGVGFLCVGAALDFISGLVKRAPRWVQAVGMEWAWRLTSDPLRLAPRYARCAEAFLLIALRRLPFAFSARPVGGP